MDADAALLNRDNMTFVLIEEAGLEADLSAVYENIGYLHYYINSYYRSNINCGKFKERQPAHRCLDELVCSVDKESLCSGIRPLLGEIMQDS